jgi:hypothetical protein
VLAEAPDVVVIATGGVPNTHPSPELFTEGSELAQSTWDVIAGPSRAGRIVLVFDDHGGEQAVAAAERLAAEGAVVEVATPDRSVGEELTGATSPPYLRALYQGGVTMTPDHRLRSIRRHNRRLVATLRNEYTGADVERVVDDVVVEHGTIPLDGLYHALVPSSRNLGETDLGRRRCVNRCSTGRSPPPERCLRSPPVSSPRPTSSSTRHSPLASWPRA